MHKEPETPQSWPKPQAGLSWFLCSWKSKGELGGYLVCPPYRVPGQASVPASSGGATLCSTEGQPRTQLCPSPSAAVDQMPVHTSAVLWAKDLLACWWLCSALVPI